MPMSDLPDIAGWYTIITDNDLIPKINRYFDGKEFVPIVMPDVLFTELYWLKDPPESGYCISFTQWIHENYQQIYSQYYTYLSNDNHEFYTIGELFRKYLDDNSQ